MGVTWPEKVLGKGGWQGQEGPELWVQRGGVSR